MQIKLYRSIQIYLLNDFKLKLTLGVCSEIQNISLLFCK